MHKGGLKLPYFKARSHHFDELVKQGLVKMPKPFQDRQSLLEEAIADKVAAKLQPTLEAIVNDAVKKAMEGLCQHLPNVLQSHQPQANRAASDSWFTTPPISEPPPAVEPQCQTPALPLLSLPLVHSPPQDQPASLHSLAPSPPISHTTPTVDQALVRMGLLLHQTDPKWTCQEQCIAMQAVLECKQDVLAILKTSSGKSMLMVIPALLEKNRVTVTVLPLKSLLMDYIRKLKMQGISFEVFDSTPLTGQHNLILVTIDQARTPQWRQQIAELNTRIPVVRIVFDEGHYAITDQDFRQVLEDVHDLRQFPMQMVVMSGTIPPKSESTIRDAFCLTSDALVIRTPSHRPELQYIVEPPAKTNPHIAVRVQAIIKNYEPMLAPEDRILVFVPYLDNGEALAKFLKCDFFCGGQTTCMAKSSMYERWISGQHRVMVCTNAFGAGNDYPHVRLVIHAGNPRHVMGYIQESSRGGRDKRPSKCIILPRITKEPILPQNIIDHKGEGNMYQMLFGQDKDRCICYCLTSFNDEHGVSCQSSPQACSRCTKPSSHLPTSSSKRPFEFEPPSVQEKSKNPFMTAFQESKRRRIVKEVSTDNYVSRFKVALHKFTYTCPFCKVQGVAEAKFHPMAQCPTLHQYTTPTGYLDFTKAIHYGDKQKTFICYRCHIPLLNNKLHPPVQFPRVSCTFMDVLPAVALLTYFQEHLKKEASEFFGCNWTTEQEFLNWLNGEAPVGHYSSITMLFLWYMEHSMQSIQ